ncbi:CoA pyrophosphatase [Halioxenophilus sp. WMMB6]|uniref:NUDIX hydrolase n=1 Tax=Halioxenophilus sp. WMMB6 TaxID=3073815 RepID=UPI00295EA774|nr:CoA pyrophosphatase [Halioxenophilus sp. WMMB6]
MSQLILKNLLPLNLAYKTSRLERDAAVLVPLTGRGSGIELVLTQRSGHLNSHAGEVSFPGGKWEPGDHSPADTALRETEEEIALPRGRVALLGELPNHVSKHGLRVTPVVGWIDQMPTLVANPEELDSVFRVPLAFFLEDERVRTDIYSAAGITHWSPAWRFQEYEIWGLTARVLVNLMNLAFGANITRKSGAPENFRS